jgi:hypothetical protein
MTFNNVAHPDVLAVSELLEFKKPLQKSLSSQGQIRLKPQRALALA